MSAPLGRPPSGAPAAARVCEPPSSAPGAPNAKGGISSVQQGPPALRRRGTLTLATASRGRGGWPGSGADSRLRRVATPPRVAPPVRCSCLKGSLLKRQGRTGRRRNGEPGSTRSQRALGSTDRALEARGLGRCGARWRRWAVWPAHRHWRSWGSDPRRHSAPKLRSNLALGVRCIAPPPPTQVSAPQPRSVVRRRRGESRGTARPRRGAAERLAAAAGDSALRRIPSRRRPVSGAKLRNHDPARIPRHYAM